jgi:GNAT superfamily N-acetyltransferase
VDTSERGADKVSEAYAAAANLTSVRGNWSIVAGIPCMHLGVPEPWATQARALSRLPDQAALTAVGAWLREHSPHWSVATRAEWADAPTFSQFEHYVTLPAFVMTDPGAAATGAIEGYAVGTARTRDEFLSVYGEELRPLVTERHLVDPAHRMLVGRLNGKAIACAQVRAVAGTAYLSAVTVLPQMRGHGYGTAISVAATRLGGTFADLVWLHATHRSRTVYERIGFRWITDHVLLIPRSV